MKHTRVQRPDSPEERFVSLSAGLIGACSLVHQSHNVFRDLVNGILAGDAESVTMLLEQVAIRPNGRQYLERLAARLDMDPTDMAAVIMVAQHSAHTNEAVRAVLQSIATGEPTAQEAACLAIRDTDARLLLADLNAGFVADAHSSVATNHIELLNKELGN